MPLPKHVQVGPYQFTVREVREVSATEPETDGLCRSSEQRIELRKGLPRDYRAECLVHELLHALWFVTRLPEDVEEEHVKRLAPALLDLFRRNPDLTDWLLS